MPPILLIPIAVAIFSAIALVGIYFASPGVRGRLAAAFATRRKSADRCGCGAPAGPPLESG